MTTDQRNGRGTATIPDAPRPDVAGAVDRLAPEKAEPSAKTDRANRKRPSLGPRPEPLVATDALATAGRKVMWVHLDRLLARESGARDAERPDELRRYRVATRRLRAALRMFAADYPDSEVRPLRRALSDLAGAVGAVRDLDLRIADLNRWAIERGPDAVTAIAPMTVAWGRERERAVASLHRRWGSKRHRRFLTKLVRFVESDSSRKPDDPTLESLTVQDRAASRIWLAYEEVRAFAPVVPSADLETLHRLRIAGKRLRDTLEFLGEVLGPERASLIERLVALQDHLGTLNDATVAVDAVRAFLAKRHVKLGDEEQAEIAAYLADKEGEVLALQESVGRPWRQIAGSGFAGRLGRAVVVRGVAP